MGISSELRSKYAHIWDAEKNHPFVTGVGDGTLPLENFQYYMRQDFLFLVDYCRVTAMAVAKAETMDVMQWFARGLHSTLNTEMALHIESCEEFGITEAELMATEPSPATLAYTGHLLRVAANGTAGEIGAAMLPCALGYEEIGRMLYDRGLPAGQPLYGQWIEMYASEEYASLNVWLRDFVDKSASRAGEVERARMDDAFRLASKHEYNFWDAAYRMETWAV